MPRKETVFESQLDMPLQKHKNQQTQSLKCNSNGTSQKWARPNSPAFQETTAGQEINMRNLVLSQAFMGAAGSSSGVFLRFKATNHATNAEGYTFVEIAFDALWEIWYRQIYHPLFVPMVPWEPSIIAACLSRRLDLDNNEAVLIIMFSDKLEHLLSRHVASADVACRHVPPALD